jgi:N-acetylmuramoyl-L-alanine amidase
MRLYRLGDEGPAVQDIQDRLLALGLAYGDDPPGVFGEGTKEAVVSFQSSRGLDPDGIVGPDTWRALYEAGYRLGDRLLFLRRPMMRGEDVAELQTRLNNLGFDAGKPDGIFGPDTERAVIEFQHNRGLTEDGVVGPEVVTELRLVTRGPLRRGREAVRELEWLRSLPTTLVGAKVAFDAAARTTEEAARCWAAAVTAAVELQNRGGLPLLSRSMDEALPERVRARRANRAAAELIVSFQHGDDAVLYFATPTTRSEAGYHLAVHVHHTLGGDMSGRATPILRETRAPAVVVVREDMGAAVGARVVEALEAFFRDPGLRSPAAREHTTT